MNKEVKELRQKIFDLGGTQKDWDNLVKVALIAFEKALKNLPENKKKERNEDEK